MVPPRMGFKPVKMLDWERLKLTKRTLQQMEQLGKRGMVSFLHVSLVLGTSLVTEVGKVLGLTFGSKTKGSVKPMYVFLLDSLCRLALARWPDANFDLMIKIMQQAITTERQAVTTVKHSKGKKVMTKKKYKKVMFLQ